MDLPVLLLTVVGAIDYAAALRQKLHLQRVADAAALAAANELSMSNSRTQDTSAIVQTLDENYLKAAFNNSKFTMPAVKTAINAEPLQVKLKVSQTFEPFFGDPLGLQSAYTDAQAVT